MPSQHPPSRVFVHPETADLVALFAKREETDVSTIIRSALCWAAANPIEMARNIPRGRSKVLQYRVPESMRETLKTTCHYASRPVSEYVALAVTLYVVRLADELRTGKRDETIYKARIAMRDVLKQLSQRGELPAWAIAKVSALS